MQRIKLEEIHLTKIEALKENDTIITVDGKDCFILSKIKDTSDLINERGVVSSAPFINQINQLLGKHFK